MLKYSILQVICKDFSQNNDSDTNYVLTMPTNQIIELEEEKVQLRTPAGTSDDNVELASLPSPAGTSDGGAEMELPGTTQCWDQVTDPVDEATGRVSSMGEEGLVDKGKDGEDLEEVEG